jgi:DNA-binding response OmpR family regulator
MTNKTILIIDDEEPIRELLKLTLQSAGFDSVLEASNGEDGLALATRYMPDLILLDLMLPELSGIEVCRRIRQKSSVPIIMLTAKDDVSDKVMGLDMGADDYMTKPFAIEELLARIRVALKRQTDEGGRAGGERTLSEGLLSLDRDSREVKFGEADIQLTKKEFDLLEYLMLNRNVAISRNELLDKVWGYSYAGDTNVVDVYIRYLRAKIDERFGEKYIHTMRGVGYVIKD